MKKKNSADMCNEGTATTAVHAPLPSTLLQQKSLATAAARRAAAAASKRSRSHGQTLVKNAVKRAQKTPLLYASSDR
jgi:hypothetical protein